MSETYTQCRLRNKHTETTAWIPSENAVAGRWIFVEKRGQMRQLWEVVSCGATLSAEYVEEHERDFRTQRQASDI